MGEDLVRQQGIVDPEMRFFKRRYGRAFGNKASRADNRKMFLHLQTGRDYRGQRFGSLAPVDLQ
jgi:hypothetical protein